MRPFAAPSHTAITQAIDAAAREGVSIDTVRQFSRHKGIGSALNTVRA